MGERKQSDGHASTGLRTAFVLAGVVLAAAACSGGTPAAVTSPPGSAPSTGSSVPAPATTAPPASGAVTEPADATVRAELTTAYEAESGALATYRAVVAALGPVGPFPNVVESEQQHESTLSALLVRYAVPIPVAAPGQPSPTTRSAACALGVSIEGQLVALYGSLVSDTAPPTSVATVFRALQAASRDDHLPAFQRCA
jgi:hypothetical protein